MFQKLDQCRTLFKSCLLVTQDLLRDKEARKSVQVKKATESCIKIISQLRGAPSRKDASSQDCGLPVMQGLRGLELFVLKGEGLIYI